MALPSPYIDPTLGALEGDIILDVEVVNTGSGANQIMGGLAGVSVTLNGGPGNDTFVEGIQGATGGSNDTITGNGGVDTVDYSQRTNSLSVTMDGKTASGDPAGGLGGAGEADIIGTDIQNIKLGLGGGVYKGNALDNTFFSSANVPAAGKAGAPVPMSTVYGYAGDDTLNEGTDVNSLCPDTFYGGDGTDTVDYSGRVHSVFILMDGSNASGEGTLATAPYTIAGAWTGAPNVPIVTEGDIIGTDVENALGGSAADLIIGNANANSLEGKGGDGDTICGLGGQDTLVGYKTHAASALSGGTGDSLHGNDCPSVITLNGTGKPTVGVALTADTTETNSFNTCIYPGSGAGHIGTPSGGGAAGIAVNCAVVQE